MSQHPKMAHAWFPAEWDFGDLKEDGIGGPLPLDPLVIYVQDDQLDLEDNNSPIFWFSLREMVVECIGDGDPAHAGMRRIRQGLIDLVKLFDDDA